MDTDGRLFFDIKLSHLFIGMLPVLTTKQLLVPPIYSADIMSLTNVCIIAIVIVVIIIGCFYYPARQ